MVQHIYCIYSLLSADLAIFGLRQMSADRTLGQQKCQSDYFEWDIVTPDQSETKRFHAYHSGTCCVIRLNGAIARPCFGFFLWSSLGRESSNLCYWLTRFWRNSLERMTSANGDLSIGGVFNAFFPKKKHSIMLCC